MPMRMKPLPILYNAPDCGRQLRYPISQAASSAQPPCEPAVRMLESRTRRDSDADPASTSLDAGAGKKGHGQRIKLSPGFLAREGVFATDMPSKLSKEAKRFAAATRRHLKESRAISMLGFDLEAASPGHAVLRMDGGR